MLKYIFNNIPLMLKYNHTGNFSALTDVTV